MEESKNSVAKEILSWVLCLAIAGITAYVLNTYVLRLTIVSGDSMNHTLINGQTLYVDKLGLRMSEPKRGDILIVEYPGSGKENFVKRVIGLSGEKIAIKNGKVYINGDDTLDKWAGEHNLHDMDEVIIPDDSCFVMGDNRSDSKDSRTKSVGPISRDHIIGRAVFRIYPFNQFGKIDYKY